MLAYNLCGLALATRTRQATIIFGPLVATCVAEDSFGVVAALGAGKPGSALGCHTSLSVLIGYERRISKACEETGGSKGSERQADALFRGALYL